jgi:hypothetical protein
MHICAVLILKPFCSHSERIGLDIHLKQLLNPCRQILAYGIGLFTLWQISAKIQELQGKKSRGARALAEASALLEASGRGGNDY